MSGYRFGPGVREDLVGIWEYIATDNLQAADEWLDRLYAQFDHLAEFPRAGHSRPDLAENRPLLFWPVGTYLVIYRLWDDVVEIVAVSHAARHIPRFLRSRDPNENST
jgi:plasmid stabilization system protein ParE